MDQLKQRIAELEAAARPRRKRKPGTKRRNRAASLDAVRQTGLVSNRLVRARGLAVAAGSRCAAQNVSRANFPDRSCTQERCLTLPCLALSTSLPQGWPYDIH